MDIEKKVNEFKTKYKEGFTDDEIELLLENFPSINRDRFNDALMGVTCVQREGKLVIYPVDIRAALRCGLENRDLNRWEWD